jgi:hypothetical protein
MKTEDYMLNINITLDDSSVKDDLAYLRSVDRDKLELAFAEVTHGVEESLLKGDELSRLFFELSYFARYNEATGTSHATYTYKPTVLLGKLLVALRAS